MGNHYHHHFSRKTSIARHTGDNKKILLKFGMLRPYLFLNALKHLYSFKRIIGLTNKSCGIFFGISEKHKNNNRFLKIKKTILLLPVLIELFYADRCKYLHIK